MRLNQNDFPKIKRLNQNASIQIGSNPESNVPLFNIEMPNLSPDLYKYPYNMGIDLQNKIRDAKFIVKIRALDTIQHLWAEGYAAYSDPLLQGYNEMIDNSFFEIAETYFYKGFWLLSDYLYDSNNNFYASDEDKCEILILMLYAFWYDKVPHQILPSYLKVEQYLQAYETLSLVSHSPVLNITKELYTSLTTHM